VGPNSFRYNISENDQAMMGSGSGAIAINSGRVSYVYNNAIYRSGSLPGSNAASCISFGLSGIFPKETLIANNLCINSIMDRMERTRYLDAGAGPDVSAVTVINNRYYNPAGYQQWKWHDVEYSSLEAYQLATKKDGSSLVKDPRLVGMGAGGTCLETARFSSGPQPCPLAYQINRNSVALVAGVNLSLNPYDLQPGSRDYFGYAISHATGSGYNIGADGSAP
jgi:hypothetical protein